MPGRQSFCWCFGGRPPEITYGIDTEAPLKSMEVNIPMPDDEKEIDAKFAEIVVSYIYKFMQHRMLQKPKELLLSFR